MTASPYAGLPPSGWPAVTRELVARHPLKSPDILSAVQVAWPTLWQTTIGGGALSVPLAEVGLPATVVGYFFEVLLARELQRTGPGVWRGNLSRGEKDLVYLPDPSLSVEVKTSGQAGFRIYGNRSYGQKSEAGTAPKKEKSGYYLVVNFLGQTLTLVRFGWIDEDDWKSQKSQTGQMAGLSKDVYDGKLVIVQGEYRKLTPVTLLGGVGKSALALMHQRGIHTIGDFLLHHDELPKSLERVRRKNAELLAEIRGATS